MDYEMHIDWEFEPFYRRWQGWKLRSIIWWFWPIRWCLHRNQNGMTIVDYYLSANDAAIAMAKFIMDHDCNKAEN